MGERDTQNVDERFEDIIQPFLIDQTHLHGRFARLSDVADTILTRHDYPLPVSTLLGELLVLTAMMGNMLKHQGLVTVQIQGDGPIKLMVADCTSEGALRGYADLDDDKVAELQASKRPVVSIKKLLGKGYIAVTLDHQLEKDRYQGIVELKGDNLTASFLKYFKQSAQFDVHIKTAVERRKTRKDTLAWRASGIMIQRLPDEPVSQQIILSPEEAGVDVVESPREAWRRTKLYIKTLTDQEMFDAELPPRDLLYRLFNEDGVWVNEAWEVDDACRCSRDRMGAALASLQEDDLQYVEENGAITINCQFCTREEQFSADEIRAMADSS